MIKIYYLTILLCSCILSLAQLPDIPVRFANGDLSTGNNVRRGTFSKTTLLNSISGEKYYVLVQFAILPSEEIKKQLLADGVELNEYIPGNAFLATINTSFNFSNADQYNIASINIIPVLYKIDPSLINFKKNSDKKEQVTFAINCFSPSDKAQAETILREMGVHIISSKYKFARTILIQPDVNKINSIAALPFVSFITQQFLSDKIINYNDVALHGISSLQSVSGRNLEGKSVIVGVGDNADISSHIDFNGKIISRHPFPVDDHGTHTSGTTAGGGFLNPRNHGMAPRAHIVSQWFSDVIVNTPTYITDYNMVATNNSYYSSGMGCNGSRKYDVLSNYIDDQMKDHDEVLHVIASGNDGSLTCAGYPANFGTVKSGWQCAKNVITVGAIDQANYGIAGFSSRGPALDGRIKPEIVTNGYGTLSTYPNDAYELNYGTSMAAPVVTGVTALLQEDYRKTHAGANAKAALLKALMCNTSEDLGNPGPDYTFGFGMLNARKAAETMEANRYFTNSIVTTQSDPYNIVVPSGARRLKVLLTWADQPAAVNAGTALVNDLDLMVTAPSATVHLPMILNPALPLSDALEAADHLNNIEQVIINNPAAGSYSINVNGFAIPQGPQVYFLTYEIEMNGITVEYPFGGETLVPGDVENIRWTAYGSEANTFTVEYSENNGGSWSPVGTGTAAATARSLNWTVPSTATNNYRVRVTRNSTTLTDQSDFTFSVLGQPVVVATVPCEGYVQLNWGAIGTATSYEIFQLDTDSMKLIGNTVVNSYLVEGLNNSTSYRFAVAAKNGAVNGRRSIAIKITPATGTCSLVSFNDNFKAVSIDGPVTGRQFTASALTSNESVRLTIKNLDNVISSGTYDLSYQVNSGSVFTENVAVNINALSNYTHTFAPTAAFNSPGLYNLKAWVQKSGDIFHSDDTVSVIIKNLANPLLVLPVTDGFETTAVKDYTFTFIGIDGDDRTDFKPGSSRGRARTFLNTGIALNGNRAITLDQYPYGALNTDSLLLTWNLGNYNTSNQLRIDFNYKNHGQANNPNNKVYIRGGDNFPWTFAYDLVYNQNDLGLWKHGIININDIMDTVAVPQSIGSSFQIKITQEGKTSANVSNPLQDQDDGYTIDDVSIAEAIGDVAVQSIASPLKDGCGLTSNYPVSIRVKNYMNNTINNITVNYQVNGGTIVTETIPTIAGDQLIAYTFTARADLSAYIDYSINTWITSGGDNYHSNDSINNYTVHNSPVINAYPYMESFESNNGNWYTKGLNTTWEWGTPAKTLINKAANGTKGWITGLTDNYADNELSYLYSPCFDLSGMTQPVLSFSHIFEIEEDYDYTWVEYSTDGVIWNKLGTAGSGTNWYDNITGNNWRTSKTKWHVASTDIPPYAGNMRFRFVLSSDAGVNYEGVGIDDVRIHEKQSVTIYLPVLSGTQNISNSNWQPYTEMVTGGIFAEINSHGQNLGNVGIDVYQNTAAPVRFSNGQMYLDRSFVIHSDNPPSGPIGVRVYFTDTEANTLINATNCPTCGKPNDAYELGVTQYSGDYFTDENGDVNDDITGFFNFISPSAVEILPHANGYYAEFSVNNFSEFYLSKASIKPVTSNICPGTNFSFNAAMSGATYQWQVDNGTGFVNIIDGPNYSGSSASILQLINLPTSNAGYIYRCVVNAVNGPEITLRFVTIWTGTTNTDWMTGSNWNCNVIPDQYTDVIIPGGLANNPVLNANTSIRSFRAYPNAPVLIKTGNNLDIKN
ncbi:MAG: S8 family serine peptidase [Ferruginibacter sp.]